MSKKTVEPLVTDEQVAKASYETLLADWLANTLHLLNEGQAIEPGSPCHHRLELLLQRKAREDEARS